MQDLNNENTLPTKAQSGLEPQGELSPKPENGATLPVRSQNVEEMSSQEQVQGAPEKPVKRRRWPWFILGICLVLLFTAGGTYLGYLSAIQLRQAKQAEAIVTRATEHFMLGIQAQAEGKYGIARQHFEFVAQLDPNFPGVTEKLTEVMIAQMATSTPTLAPTPTEIVPTPTPDTRTQEEIYNQARAYFSAGDWDNLFVTIDALRTVDPMYKAVEVDGMLYKALRYRGIRKIYQEANLEGGIYDLKMAERFAPLDAEAKGARDIANMYLSAVAFWGADWGAVVQSLEAIYPSMPNLRDGSGWTAIERYRIAAVSRGDQLAASNDFCGAYEYYEKARQIASDANLEAAMTEAYEGCYSPTEETSESEEPTATVEAPQGETPTTETGAPDLAETETPSPSPTTEETETPAEEP